MRSWVKARSYCANAPNTLKRNAPCGVVVSICSVRERKATPYTCKVVTMCRRCGSERPSRSSFQTTRQSPAGRRRAPAGVLGDHPAPRWPYLQTAAADRRRRRARRRVAGPSSADRCRSTPAYSLPACPENPSFVVAEHPDNPTEFFEQIWPGSDGGVKAPRPGVGNHVFLGRSAEALRNEQKVAGRDAQDLRAAPRHETPCRPRRDGTWADRQDTTLPPHPAGPQSQSPSTAASRSAAAPLVSPTRAARPSLRSSAVCFSVAGCWRQGASASTRRTTPRCRA